MIAFGWCRGRPVIVCDSQLRAASFTYFGEVLRCPHKRIVTTVVPATAGPLGERPPALAGHFCNVPQGSTLAVFRYPENPRFPDGIPDLPEQ